MENFLPQPDRERIVGAFEEEGGQLVTARFEPRNFMEQNNNSKEHLLTLADVGERLSLSKRAVYRLIAKGDLPKPVKLGGATRLYESDLEEFFQTLKSERK